MQRKPDEPVVGAVARELCQRAGARATVEGSIAPLGSSYVIALGVHDCQTGAAIAQEQTQADSKEGVLKAVGTTVTSLRKRLGESLASIAKNDVPAEATTRRSRPCGVRAGSSCARHEVGRRVDPVLPAGDREGSELRAGAREARRRALERRPRRGREGRGEEGLRSARHGQRVRAALHSLELLHARTGDDAKTKETLELLTTTVSARLRGKEQLRDLLGGKGQIRGRARAVPGRARDCAERASAGHQRGQQPLRSRAATTRA